MRTKIDVNLFCFDAPVWLICFTLDVGPSCHADFQFINLNLVEATSRFSHFQCIATSAFAGARRRRTRPPVRTAPSIPKENVMRRRLMVVLAGAALVGSLLATDAQARGGGGHGGGGHGGGGVAHAGRFGGAHIGARAEGIAGRHVGGIGGRYMAGVSRVAVGRTAGTGYGTRIGHGTSIRYGTRISHGTGIRFGTRIGNGTGIRFGNGIHFGNGIFADRLSGLGAAEFAQTATFNDAAAADMPAPASGAVQQPPVGGTSGEAFSGPGLTTVGGNAVSTKTAGTKTVDTKTVGMAPASSASAPSNTQNKAAPAFKSGSLVRLRSGGPLMTVKDIKGDQVDCFWTDVNDQINADSFPVDVLQQQ
jgi:uncharacterized protein YodC (DUF2158 family)